MKAEPLALGRHQVLPTGQQHEGQNWQILEVVCQDCLEVLGLCRNKATGAYKVIGRPLQADCLDRAEYV